MQGLLGQGVEFGFYLKVKTFQQITKSIQGYDADLSIFTPISASIFIMYR